MTPELKWVGEAITLGKAGPFYVDNGASVFGTGSVYRNRVDPLDLW